MNSIIKGIGITLSCILIASSCSEISFGDSFLGDQPESSGATTEEMFSSKINAEKVLVKAYSGLPYGLPTSSDNKLGGNILESITDLCYSFRDNISDGPVKLYYNGSLSATNVPTSSAYRLGGKSDWTTIRYAWLFIENVDKVPDMSDSEKSRRKAEAQMLIALSYFEMLRYIGGIPWIDHYVEVDEDMTFPRISFAQSVENIVSLLDQAKSVLPWYVDETEDGRMTKAGAMALKFKVLQWAASPTFNSAWHSAADEYTRYTDSNVATRWQAAAAAGKDLFEELDRQGHYELIQPTEETHKARRLAYRQAYYNRGGTEILISTRKGYAASSTHSIFIDQRYYSGPTLNYVDMFPWEDGTDFPENFNWEAPEKQPFFTKGDMVPTRDPRLYENVACPGDLYCNGTTAPVYLNHADYKNGSGFLIMKFILQETNDRSAPVQWPHTRLAEIMLGYAEVLNEVNDGPTTEAVNYLNDVRSRVGLKALSFSSRDKEAFKEAVLKERALELGFEEVRWFDLVRYGRTQDFTKKLYGLQSRGNDLNNPTEFTFKKVELDERYWATTTTFDTKWYLAPIPQDEINKQYGMTQNPGW